MLPLEIGGAEVLEGMRRALARGRDRGIPGSCGSGRSRAVQWQHRENQESRWEERTTEMLLEGKWAGIGRGTRTGPDSSLCHLSFAHISMPAGLRTWPLLPFPLPVRLCGCSLAASADSPVIRGLTSPASPGITTSWSLLPTAPPLSSAKIKTGLTRGMSMPFCSTYSPSEPTGGFQLT